MPRTLLQKTEANPLEISTQVDVALALNRIDKHILSARLGMPMRTLNHKLSTGTWTYKELFELFKILKMDSENILKIFGR